MPPPSPSAVFDMMVRPLNMLCGVAELEERGLINIPPPSPRSSPPCGSLGLIVMEARLLEIVVLVADRATGPPAPPLRNGVPSPPVMYTPPPCSDVELFEMVSPFRIRVADPAPSAFHAQIPPPAPQVMEQFSIVELLMVRFPEPPALQLIPPPTLLKLPVSLLAGLFWFLPFSIVRFSIVASKLRNSPLVSPRAL